MYDLNDNVIEKWAGEESKITYTYDSLDRVTAITNPLGNSRKFSYDAADRIVLYQDETGAITEYDYSPTGNLTLVKDALGNETHYDYDMAGNLTTVQQYGLIDAELEKVSEQNRVTQYQYDLLRNVTSVTDALGNQEQYDYDENNQLIKKTDKDGYQTVLDYNQTGQVQKLNYSDGKEVLMQYNPLRKLEAVKDWLGTTQKQIQYILDLTKPYNNLLERKVNEDKEQYLWDNDLLTKNEEEYFLLDDLGSPLRQLTTTGQTMEEYGFDEFGQALFNTPTNQSFGFTGYQQDDISGLNYAQARYYDQKHGRFMSEDNIKGVISIPETMNAYSYVWNNPLILVDLDGNFPVLIGAGLIGATLGVVSQGVSDLVTSAAKGKLELSGIESYLGAATGGAVAGVATVLAPVIAGIANGVVSTSVTQVTEKITGTKDRPLSEIAINTVVSGTLGGVIGKFVPSIDKVDDWLGGGTGTKKIIDRLINEGAKHKSKLLGDKMFIKFMDDIFDELGPCFFANLTANEMLDKLVEWFNTPLISASSCLD